MENRAKRELARKRLIIHSVLCALLPPAGMLLVWRSRYQRRFKLLMTLCSTLILMFMFSIGLAVQKPTEIVPPTVSAGHARQTQQEEIAPAPEPEIMMTVTPAPEIIDEGLFAPANPNG